MIYKSFEEMPVWKDTRKLVNEIYQLTKSGFRRDYSLIDQLRRAAVSILLNISEGLERKSKQEVAYFLSIAKGSAGEVRAIIYIALDQGYLEEQAFLQLLNQIQSISRQLSSFGAYLKTSNDKMKK